MWAATRAARRFRTSPPRSCAHGISLRRADASALALAGKAPQHIGYLVTDLERALEGSSSAVGVSVTDPIVLELGAADIEVGGPATLRLGFTMWGPLMVEFIEPPGGDDVWSRALNARGPGLHHVAFTEVARFDDVVAELTGDGYDVIAAGHFGVERWCYVERSSLVIELTSGPGPAVRTGRAESSVEVLDE